MAINNEEVLTRVEYHSRRIGMLQTIMEIRHEMLKNHITVEDLIIVDELLNKVQIKLEEEWEEMRI